MTKKRGRKSGSGSFIQVSLEDLNRVLKPHARVIVWNRYAQMLGLDGKKVAAKNDALVAAVQGGTTEIKLESFDEKASEPKAPIEQEKPELVPKPDIVFEQFD